MKRPARAFHPIDSGPSESSFLQPLHLPPPQELGRSLPCGSCVLLGLLEMLPSTKRRQAPMISSLRFHVPCFGLWGEKTNVVSLNLEARREQLWGKARCDKKNISARGNSSTPVVNRVRKATSCANAGLRRLLMCSQRKSQVHPSHIHWCQG
jgi:hypothetical protein